MSKTFDQGKEEVAKLCRYFATNRQAFLAPGAREADVRQSLIDPFFEALGWDVRNTAMTALQYREVIFEDSLDVEGHQKTPDYTFRVGPVPKFYAEAKKCGVNIGADPGPAYQLRRYGWSGKVALSVLTDFEELGVYDCTMRPRPSDQASHARIQYLRCDEYPGRWRELWDVFSREAVWSGAFDQYAKSKRKRGTSEVDVEFLREIEGWRDELARDIALRNKDLPLDDLNTAVQMTIDRVVFLRMAEDRGLEPYAQLLKLCERPDIYPRFMRDLCRRADQRYNSGLFHFQKESGVSEDPDRITPKLTVDDRVFKPILERLYFEHGSPYHFGLLPVEILGTVYERFLGKVIRLTAGHQAKVEEKPEVRQAGGVYYTPAYIVDYIVKHTVGQQVEGRSPAQLAGEKGKPAFRVLDMACGSGSFLLGAYQCLLDYCLKWYIEHKPETHKKAVYKDPRKSEWRLTIEEKKRILTTHIFGVDIDAQAVEVSKLSLLLKVLEGETDQSFSLSLLPFSDRALPNLADNIKCGNSLIGPDYFTGKLIADAEEMKRVNPFDWARGFPDAMKAGGFDCVIGNPPYGIEFEIQLKAYMEITTPTFRRNNDKFAAFTEKALHVTRQGGQFGFIIPNTYLAGPYFNPLKEYLLTVAREISVVDFGHALVFPRPNVFTCVTLIQKSKGMGAQQSVISMARIAEPSQINERPPELVELTVAGIESLEWTPGSVLYKRLCALFGNLEQYCLVKDVGLNYWTVGRGKKRGGSIADRVLYQGEQQDHRDRPFLKGRNIDRYVLETPSSWLRHDWGKRIEPNVDKFRFDEQLLCQDKVVYRQTADHPRCAFDSGGYLTDKTVHSIVWRAECRRSESYLYLLGIMNSRLFRHLYEGAAREAGRAFAQVKVFRIRGMPFRAIDFSDGSDKWRHDRMVELVDSMQALHTQFAAARSAAQKDVMQRQIDATDAEIDRLVYDLYGLTAEEIAIVEGKDQ